jgi:hypothetical protein
MGREIGDTIAIHPKALPAASQSRSVDREIEVNSAVSEYVFNTRDSIAKCVCDFSGIGETEVAKKRPKNRKYLGIIPNPRRSVYCAFLYVETHSRDPSSPTIQMWR